MSDGINEARRGTFFQDRSNISKQDEVQEMKREMKRLISWHEDLGRAINMLAQRIEDSEEI